MNEELMALYNLYADKGLLSRESISEEEWMNASQEQVAQLYELGARKNILDREQTPLSLYESAWGFGEKKKEDIVSDGASGMQDGLQTEQPSSFMGSLGDEAAVEEALKVVPEYEQDQQDISLSQKVMQAKGDVTIEDIEKDIETRERTEERRKEEEKREQMVSQEEQAKLSEFRGSDDFQIEIESINDDQLNKDINVVISDFQDKYKKYGITFDKSAWNNMMVVRNSDGSDEIKISLRDIEGQGDKLKEFIASNAVMPEDIKEEDYLTKSFNVRKSRAKAMKNDDGSVSTVRMASADNFAFPTIFPKDPDNQTSNPADWFVFDISKREDVEAAIKMAQERGEIYKFDTSEEANEFAEGGWKDVSITDTEGKRFFDERGLDYTKVMKAEKRRNEVQQEIAFIEKEIGLNKAAEYNPTTGKMEGGYKPSEEVIKNNPDIYLEDGTLRSDVNEKLKRLQKENEELGNIVYFDENAKNAIQDYNVFLHKKYNQYQSEAINQNKELNTALENLKKQYSSGDVSQEDFVVGVQSLKKQQQDVSEKYFLASTYLNQKTKQDIQGEFLDNFEAFSLELSKGIQNGNAASKILAISLGLDPTDEYSAEELANILKNLDKRQGRAFYDYMNSSTTAESWDAFLSNPGEVLSSLVGNSFGQLLPIAWELVKNPETFAATVGTGAVYGGVKASSAGLLGTLFGALGGGLATLSAATNFAMEYSNAILDVARDKEYDLEDPEQALKALQDETVWEEGGEIGIRRGLAIGLVELMSAGLAGRVFKVADTASKARKALAFTTERAVFDPLSEGLGELSAQVVSGQEVDMFEIVNEMAGGLGSNAGTATFNIFSRSDKQAKINKAYDLTSRDAIAKERSSFSEISNWTSEMQRLGQIDNSVADAIQENLVLRNESNKLLGLSKSKKNEKLVSRTMDLLKAQKTLNENENSRKIYKEELSSIENELSYMVKNGKLAPEESMTNIDNIKDETGEIVSLAPKTKSYSINGRRYSKAGFQKKFDKMSEQQKKDASFDIKNDEEFKAEVTKDYGVLPTQAEVTTDTKVEPVGPAIIEETLNSIDEVPTEVREAAVVVQEKEDGTFQIDDKVYDTIPEEVMQSDAVITQRQDGKVDMRYNEDNVTVEAAPITEVYDTMDAIPQTIQDATSTQIVENDEGKFEVTYKESEVLGQVLGEQKSEPRFRAEEKNFSVESAIDEMGDIDYDAEAEVSKIAKKRDLGITSDREISVVARDKNGKIIGGAYTSYDNSTGEYTFDIVVDESVEGKGVGSMLLDQVKDLPFDIEEMNPDATVKVDVVNPQMQKMLEKRGFEVVEKIGKDRVIMQPSSDPRFRLKEGEGRIAEDKKLAADVKRKQKAMPQAEKDFLVPRGKPVREDVDPLAESRSTTKFTEEDAKELGFDSVEDMSKNIEDFEGVPMGVVMSDHLASGMHKDSTGKPMELGGGILFNTLGAIKNRLLAWAGVNKEGANLQYEEAKMIYKANKPLFERLWAEGKIPYGHIPFAVAKMGETAMNSNEAVFRWLSPKLKELEKKYKNTAKSAFDIFVKQIEGLQGLTPKQRKTLEEDKLKLEQDPSNDTLRKKVENAEEKQSKQVLLDFIKKNKIKTVSQLLDAIVKDSAKRAKDPNNADLTLPVRAFAFDRIFSVSKAKDIKNVTPSKDWIKELLADSKNRKEENQVFVANSDIGVYNQITEPSMLEGRQGDIVSIVGIKVLKDLNENQQKELSKLKSKLKEDPKNEDVQKKINQLEQEAGGVKEAQHNNYGFGPEGKLIAFLKNPMHGTDVFAEWEVKSARVFKKDTQGKMPSKEKLLTQIGGAFFIDKAFRGMKVATQKDSSQKRKVVDLLIAKMRHAFPSVGITSTKAEFDAIMEREDVRKRVRDGMVVYGVTLDGNIYLNPEAVDIATPIHEYGHIWMDYLRYQALDAPSGKAAKLLAKGIELAKTSNKKRFDEYVKKYGDPELAAEELLVELMATRGETIVNQSLKAKFTEWFNAFFKYIKDNFTTSKQIGKKQIDKLTIEEFANIGLADLFGGTLLDGKFDPSKITDAMRARFSMMTSDGSSMSIDQVISQARQEGFSDASIKEYLKKQGYKVAEINQAMAIQIDINTQMPDAFVNVTGGSKVGIEMFNDIKKGLDNWVKSRWGKGKSFTEYRQKAMELLTEHETFKRESAINQDKLISAIDKVIGRKKEADVNAPIKSIKDTIKLLKDNDWKSNIKAVKSSLINATKPLKGSKLHGKNQKKIAGLIKGITESNIDSQLKKIDEVLAEIMADNKAANKKMNNDISDINKKILAHSKGQIDAVQAIKEIRDVAKQLMKGTKYGPIFSKINKVITSTKPNNIDFKFQELFDLMNEFFALEQNTVDRVVGLEAAINNLKEKVRNEKKQARDLKDIKSKITKSIREATQQFRELGVKEYRYSAVQRLISKVNNANLKNIDKIGSQIANIFSLVEERAKKKKKKDIATLIKKYAKDKKQSGRRIGRGTISADGQAFFEAASKFLAFMDGKYPLYAFKVLSGRQELMQYDSQKRKEIIDADPELKAMDEAGLFKQLDEIFKREADNPLISSIPDMLINLEVMSLERLNALENDIKTEKMVYAEQLANKKEIEKEAREQLKKEASEQIQEDFPEMYNEVDVFKIDYGAVYETNEDGNQVRVSPGVPATVKVTGPVTNRKLEVIVDDKVVETVYVKQEKGKDISFYISEKFNSLLGRDKILEEKNTDELKRIKNTPLKVLRDEGLKKMIENLIIRFKRSNFAVNNMGHLGTICNALDNAPAGRTFFTENIYNRLNRARSRYAKGMQTTKDKLDSFAASINPNYTYDKIKAKIFKTADIVINGVTYTGDQQMRIYALLKNDVQAQKIKKSNNFSDADIRNIENNLDPEVKQFADFIVDYLSNEYYTETNNVYTDVNNINLHKIDNYFPTSSLTPNQKRDDSIKALADIANGKLSAQGQSFLQQRTNVDAPIEMMKLDGVPHTFTNALDGLIEETERFKAYAKDTKILNNILSNPLISNVMDLTGLRTLTNQLINNEVSPILNNDASSKFLRGLFSNFVGAKLGFKLMQIPKQAASAVIAFPSYENSLTKPLPKPIETIANLIPFTYDVLTNLHNISEAYNTSPMFRERISRFKKSGFSATETTITEEEARNRLIKLFNQFRKVGEAPTALGDILGVMGYWGVYKRDIKNGMDPAKALEKFENYNKTQQTQRGTEINKWQLASRENPMWMALTTFASTPFLYMNQIMQSVNNINKQVKNVPLAKKPQALVKALLASKDGLELIFALGLGNVAFTSAAYSFKLIKGTEEDKEEVMQEINNAANGWNNILTIPFLGASIEVADKAMRGESVYGIESTINPLIETIKEITKATKAKKSITPIVIKYSTGINLDPIMGAYNYAFEGKREADFYEAIGLSKSYRPSK
jgi:GNAT superfamily N-acetyltransferase